MSSNSGGFTAIIKGKIRGRADSKSNSRSFKLLGVKRSFSDLAALNEFRQIGLKPLMLV